MTILSVSPMATCAICDSSYDDGALFCPHCGSIRQQKTRGWYGGSILLAVALLMLAVLWRIVALPPSTAEKPVVPQPPDEAAMLIAKCGPADSDERTNSGGSPGSEIRSLVFQKARVKAVFNRADPSAHGWKLRAMLDAKTQKPLAVDRLAKRLPCASASP
jgi:hypothetical protein